MIIIIISKVTIGFQCLTTIRQYAMGSKGLGGHARIQEGGGGGRGSGPHRKITRYMGRSRSKPPPTPDEISWCRAWGEGVQFISLECIRTDCLMEGQARGGGGVIIPARSFGLAKNDGFHMT